MNADMAIGVLVAAMLFVLGLVIFNAGGWTTASDIKRQCETQGSVRLQTGAGEAFFYCSRERK